MPRNRSTRLRCSMRSDSKRVYRKVICALMASRCPIGCPEGMQKPVSPIPLRFASLQWCHRALPARCHHPKLINPSARPVDDLAEGFNHQLKTVNKILRCFSHRERAEFCPGERSENRFVYGELIKKRAKCPFSCRNTIHNSPERICALMASRCPIGCPEGMQKPVSPIPKLYCVPREVGKPVRLRRTHQKKGKMPFSLPEYYP